MQGARCKVKGERCKMQGALGTGVQGHSTGKREQWKWAYVRVRLDWWDRVWRSASSMRVQPGRTAGEGQMHTPVPCLGGAGISIITHLERRVSGSRSTVLPFCNGSPSSTTAHQHPVPRAGTKQSFSTISAPSSFTLLTAPPPRAVRSRTVLTPADTRNMPQTPDTHRIHIRIQH